MRKYSPCGSPCLQLPPLSPGTSGSSHALGVGATYRGHAPIPCSASTRNSIRSDPSCIKNKKEPGGRRRRRQARMSWGRFSSVGVRHAKSAPSKHFKRAEVIYTAWPLIVNALTPWISRILMLLVGHMQVHEAGPGAAPSRHRLITHPLMHKCVLIITLPQFIGI